MPLMLISVAWDTDEGVLSLTFDRAISIANINPDAIRLKDGITTQMILVPYPPLIVVGGDTFQMSVNDGVPFTDPVVLLNVAVGNGIVAVEDGAQWAGCSDLAVPFP
jgi:hypothetical protein